VPATFAVRPVGWVRSSRTSPLDDGWDAERATIELADGVPDEALLGLDAYSHVVVLFVFDRAEEVPPAPWARHPRGDDAYPRVGIFAQRAKDRPNRLGVSTCRIARVGARRVEVEGLDAIDGTPVLDLKPYLAQFGPRGSVVQPAFVDELMAGYFEDPGAPSA
jgi:tRNA-Thr(GGU) m(6)t(6)A37 methyltransferase TsaA